MEVEKGVVGVLGSGGWEAYGGGRREKREGVGIGKDSLVYVGGFWVVWGSEARDQRWYYGEVIMCSR